MSPLLSYFYREFRTSYKALEVFLSCDFSFNYISVFLLNVISEVRREIKFTFGVPSSFIQEVCKAVVSRADYYKFQQISC